MTTRRKYVAQPGQDQRAQWKAALAAHHAAQRNRRGKRPPKPIAGVVVKPASNT
jgi:hypothetical protein